MESACLDLYWFGFVLKGWGWGSVKRGGGIAFWKLHLRGAKTSLSLVVRLGEDIAAFMKAIILIGAIRVRPLNVRDVLEYVITTQTRVL